jgi:hypothetical protein
MMSLPVDTTVLGGRRSRIPPAVRRSALPTTESHKLRWWTLVAHHRGMDQPPEFVNIELWKADAIVLFNRLMSVELNEVPITHRAEKQALMTS